MFVIELPYFIWYNIFIINNRKPYVLEIIQNWLKSGAGILSIIDINENSINYPRYFEYHPNFKIFLYSINYPNILRASSCALRSCRITPTAYCWQSLDTFWLKIALLDPIVYIKSLHHSKFVPVSEMPNKRFRE